MDMLRALLLAAEEQGRAQGAAHLRYDAGHQPAGHQPGALPYHDLAGGRAAAQMCAIGGCPPTLTIAVSSSASVTRETGRNEVVSGILNPGLCRRDQFPMLDALWNKGFYVALHLRMNKYNVVIELPWSDLRIQRNYIDFYKIIINNYCFFRFVLNLISLIY